MKILAFDLETAELWPDDAPLDPQGDHGISCAATIVMKDDRVAPTRLWYDTDDPDDMPMPRMGKHEAWQIASYLQRMLLNGYTIVTWNGSFDFQVLGVEINDIAFTAELAKRHADLMFAFMSVKGFPIGLKAAAEASGSKKGTEEMTDGALAPQMWAERKYQQVLDYVAQDALATLDVARYLLRAKTLSWITKRGGRAQRPFLLPTAVSGIEDLTVERVLQWPDPNTSWMDNPLNRHSVTQWISEALNGE